MRTFNLKTVINRGKCALSSLVATGIVAAQLACPVFASDYMLPSVAYDAFERAITVSGENIASPGSTLTLNVALDNGTPLSDSNFPVVSKMVFVSDEGNVSFAVKLPESFSPGKYAVYIGLSHNDTALRNTVLVFDKNSSATKDALDMFNDTSSASDVKTLLEEQGYNFGIDTALAGDLSAISKSMFLLKEAEGDFDYEMFDRGYRVALAVQMLSDGESADSVMKLYAGAFSTEYEKYLSLDKNIKDGYDKLMPGSELVADGFVNFEDLIPIATVIGSESQGDMKDYILENNDVFELDIDGDYEDLSVNNRSKVFGKVYAKRSDFVTAKDVRDAFDKAVKDLKNEESGKGGSGSSSSSGRGSSGSGSLSVGVPTDKTSDDKPATPGEKLPDTTDIIAPSVGGYNDIKDHFAENEINILSGKGIINGFDDGSFKPGDYVTRAQLAKMVTLAFELKEGADHKEFADVSESDWHNEYIKILSSNNIVSGDGTNFYPDNTVTRQDAAVILYNTLASIGKSYDGSAEFADSSMISDYAKTAVEALASNGIIKGDESGFRPLSPLTRAEAAVLICRIIEA